MDTSSRSGIGRMTAAVAVIAVIVVAVGVGVLLNSQGSQATSSRSSTSSSASSTASSSVTSSSSSISSSSSETSSASSTTTSTSQVPVGCVFSAPPPVNASSTTSPPQFTGCLTPGASGVYLIAVRDPNGVELVGSIRSQFPIKVTISPAAIGNLNSTGGVAFSVNGTTFDGFHNVFLSAHTGYGMTIVNQSGENNTVVLTLELFDAAAYAGG